MHKLVFTIDGFNYPHIGFTEGKRWNGWATPYFEIDEALAIMEEFNKQADNPIMYVEANDTFIHKIADDEIELWKGKNYSTNEGIKHLYGIGAYSWVWEDTTQDDIRAVAQRIEDLLYELDTYEHRDQYNDREELTEEIIAQLRDFKTLKYVIKVLYGWDLTDYAEEEIYDVLRKELRI